jgi:hypothetical protein
VWSPRIVDGLAQIERYARKLLSIHPGATDEMVSARLKGRMDRQRRLLREYGPAAGLLVDMTALYSPRSNGTVLPSAGSRTRTKAAPSSPVVPLRRTARRGSRSSTTTTCSSTPTRRRRAILTPPGTSKQRQGAFKRRRRRRRPCAELTKTRVKRRRLTESPQPEGYLERGRPPVPRPWLGPAEHGQHPPGCPPGGTGGTRGVGGPRPDGL